MKKDKILEILEKYHVSYDIAFDLADELLVSLQGEQENHSQTWMCPRCYKIHSYLKTSCDCDPNTITSTTYPQEQESDEDIVDLEDHEIHNDINEDRRNGAIE